jgi:hypothetical protein
MCRGCAHFDAPRTECIPHKAQVLPGDDACEWWQDPNQEYTDLRAERDRLTARVAELEGHLDRIERAVAYATITIGGKAVHDALARALKGEGNG